MEGFQERAEIGEEGFRIREGTERTRPGRCARARKSSHASSDLVAPARDVCSALLLVRYVTLPPSIR